MADAIRLALIDDDAAVCDSVQLYFARHNVSVTRAARHRPRFGMSDHSHHRTRRRRHGRVGSEVGRLRFRKSRSTSAACSRASATRWRRTAAMPSMRPSSPECRPASSFYRRVSAR
jgi:hypothetical protein